MKRLQIRRMIPAKTGRRRGVAVVESAVVFLTLLIILFGMLDLSLLVLEYNTLSEAARRLCRQAIVHGSAASPQMTVWGPAALSGTAADGTEQAQALRPELATFVLADVGFVIEWPNGTNRPDDPVRVTVSYQYQPLMPFVLGNQGISLNAVTTMQVAH